MDDPRSPEEILLERAKSFNKLGYLGFTGFLGFLGFINTDFFLTFSLFFLFLLGNLRSFKSPSGNNSSSPDTIKKWLDDKKQ